MDFGYKLFHVVLSMLIWAVACCLICYPVKVVWNHSLFGAFSLTCFSSFCTLLIVGIVVVLLRRPHERKV